MFNDVCIWIEFVYYFGNFVSNLLLKDYCYYKVDFVIVYPPICNIYHTRN